MLRAIFSVKLKKLFEQNDNNGTNMPSVIHLKYDFLVKTYLDH